MTPDDGRFEMTIDREPSIHSVSDVALDGRPMEGIPGLKPLEHSVLVGDLDSGLMEGISHLEPLEQLLWKGGLNFWTVRAFGPEDDLGRWSLGEDVG